MIIKNITIENNYPQWKIASSSIAQTNYNICLNYNFF